MSDTLETLAEIEAALKTVQRILDALTSRGDDEVAFDWRALNSRRAYEPRGQGACPA